MDVFLCVCVAHCTALCALCVLHCVALCVLCCISLPLFANLKIKHNHNDNLSGWVLNRK